MIDNVISEADNSNVCRSKQGQKKVALWGIRGYHRIYDVTDDVSQRPTTL